MTRDWPFGEVLKVVFPLLDGNDLTSCLLVSRQWHDIAKDENFWKCLCFKRWHDICKRPPPSISYHKLYQTFSKPTPQPPLPPQLSLEDIEFYIELWSEEQLIFSEAISGSKLRGGIMNRPRYISNILAAHLDDPNFKMIMQVEPSFTIPLGQVTASVLAARRDTNKMACILNRALFDYIDNNAFTANDYLKFSHAHSFISGIRAWVSLLFLDFNNDTIMDVFGIEIDFYNASSEDEVHGFSTCLIGREKGFSIVLS